MRSRSLPWQAWYTGFAALTPLYFTGVMGVGNLLEYLHFIPVSQANPWRALFVPFSLWRAFLAL
jgi:hypothetical protein